MGNEELEMIPEIPRITKIKTETKKRMMNFFFIISRGRILLRWRIF